MEHWLWNDYYQTDEEFLYAIADAMHEEYRLIVEYGPHKNDIPLRHIVDLILKVNAECISIEASNPRHAHDWTVWQDVRLPDGKSLMPGVVGHASDLIEDPELVAERLVRYAGPVGKDNVIAGTDCGLGQRAGHPEIVWAKLQAAAQGARLATTELWGRE